ncbi:MAG: flavin reductase family protein [Spirochaetales bacterium]|nr:flavin reductase family protein [Spirochaetales bacterium]
MNKIPEGFVSISPDKSIINPFTAIGEDWFLVTAGDENSWNTMTAAWGGLGFLWNKPVTYAFVRYSRYTYEFMEQNSHFTFSFFGSEWKKALNYCGTHSGRDTDKAAETGLVPVTLDQIENVTGPSVGFAQAIRIIISKKLYSGEISPEDFASMEIHDLYPKKDYHRMYIGSIEAILVKEEWLQKQN